MKAKRGLVLAILLVLAVLAASAETVTITYWQYFYESKVNLVNDLIKKFEA
jgi:ABC-type glycerol-3-phosphate transport system substrate-binding protein